MSGKRAKERRKAAQPPVDNPQLAAEQKDFEERKERMLKEIRDLCEKYRIDLVPVVDYTPQGIVPLIAFNDVKSQYGAKAPVAIASERDKVLASMPKAQI